MAFISMCQHTLSRAAGLMTNSQAPWLKNVLIKLAMRQFDISLAEAKIKDPKAFTSFNDFFTRELESTARPLAQSPEIACPADGLLTEFGTISPEQTFVIKNKPYALTDLFGPHPDLMAGFSLGHYASIYLSPQDYHRVHCPTPAKLTHMIAIPGELFSVNPNNKSVNFYTHNERVMAIFAIPGGQMAITMIGALLVGGVHTTWAGQVVPPREKPRITRQDYETNPLSFKQGDQIGHFEFGSSVLVLFSKDTVKWHNDQKPGQKVKMGQSIGTIAKHEKKRP